MLRLGWAGRCLASPVGAARRAVSSLAGDVELPSEASVVVVGGGVIGASVAYHLAKGGVDGVVVVEQGQLTSGTTWHAAGLIQTFGSMSETSTEFRTYSKALYASLEEDTGVATGFMPVGCMLLATNSSHLEEYRRAAVFNRYCGVDVQELSPTEVRDRFPLCAVDDVLAGFMVEDDGRVDPVNVTMALAKGARQAGARVFQGVRVTNVLKSPCGRRVAGVSTTGGDIAAPVVVNCAGMWARQLGELAGVVIPNQAAEHYYMITDTMPNVEPHWPVIEDPSSYTYVRPEGGGLMVGLFEPEAAPWNVASVPPSFAFGEIEPDWERMAPWLEAALARVPQAADAGIKKFFCGPESFTPDRAPIVGEAPELDGFFVAAGMNSIGILTGGGIGRLVARWIRDGAPDMDVTAIDIARFHPFHATPAFRRDRVRETLGVVYKHHPTLPLQTARGVKRSPIHHALQQRHAFFRLASGWESPAWFATSPQGVLDDAGSLDGDRWGRQPWFQHWRREHLAARNGVALFDMSFMSKFLVKGPQAEAILNWLCTADVSTGITYAQMLNDAGLVQADVTVCRIAEDGFIVITSDTLHRQVEAWLRRHMLARNTDASLTDVTAGYALLSLQGPRARDLLAAVTSADVSREAFPYRHVCDIDIGYAPVTASRISYVGELGYEVLVSTEFAAYVHEQLVAAGEGDGGFGLQHAGLAALNSLRLEKGFRDYGHDVDNLDHIEEVGLAFTCCEDKPGGYLGETRVRSARERRVQKPTSRLVQVALQNSEPMLYHGEVLLRDGVAVGKVRSGSYGHTVGAAVGLAMIHRDGAPVSAAFINGAKWQVNVAGALIPATVSLQPLYDPKGERMRQ